MADIKCCIPIQSRRSTTELEKVDSNKHKRRRWFLKRWHEQQV